MFCVTTTTTWPWCMSVMHLTGRVLVGGVWRLNCTTRQRSLSLLLHAKRETNECRDKISKPLLPWNTIYPIVEREKTCDCFRRPSQRSLSFDCRARRGQVGSQWVVFGPSIFVSLTTRSLSLSRGNHGAKSHCGIDVCICRCFFLFGPTKLRAWS